MQSRSLLNYCAIAVALLLLLAACGGSTASRAMCEGFQTRARNVDPLADPKAMRDQPTCDQYEAERRRITKQD